MSILLFFLIFTGFYLFGRWVGRRFGAEWTHPGETLVFSVSLGTVGLSLLITTLAFLHLLYPVTGWVLLGLMFLISPKETRATLHSIWKGVGDILSSRRIREPLSGFQVILGLLLLVLVGTAWTLASAPPIRTDALVYHLAIPKTYLEHHGITNMPNNVYSFFPHLFEMVYLFAMMFGQENLPALVGLGNAFILLIALGCYSRRYVAPQYALLVPLIFFATPTFWEVSASAYVDVALAGFVFLSFYSWDRWRETGKPHWLGFMIVFAAAAWATKLTAFIVLALVAFAIVLEARRHQNVPRLLQHLFLFAGVVSLLMIPWWARNFYFSGNPFTPLFMEILGGAENINWDPGRAALFNQYVSLFGMGRSIEDFFMLPFNLTFRSEPHSLNFDGQIGIVYFLLVPALFGVWRGRNLRAAAMTVAFTVLMIFWFLYFQYVRFLTPAFTFLVLLSVYGLKHLTPVDDEAGSLKVWNGIWKVILVLGVAFNLTLIGEVWVHKRPFDFILARESRDDYLARNIEVYPMYRAMNQHLGPDDKVLFIYMRNLGYLAERPFFSDSIFEAHTLQSILKERITDTEIRDQLRNLQVTHIMFDGRYMWGRDAAFAPPQQEAFKQFLEKRGELLERKNVYSLYRFVLD